MKMFYAVFLLLFGLGMASLRAEEKKPSDTTAPAKKIVVYYFHNTFRCPSCNSIESLTRAAVLGGKGENTKHGSSIEVTSPFADLVAAGKVTFASLNADKEEHKALLKTLKAQPKIPLIVEKDGDTLTPKKSLPKVWKLLADNKKFVDYIQGELKAFVKPETKQE